MASLRRGYCLDIVVDLAGLVGKVKLRNQVTQQRISKKAFYLYDKGAFTNDVSQEIGGQPKLTSGDLKKDK